MTTPDDKMTAHREVLKATFRVWCNDFMTIAALADWLGVDDDDARTLVDMGRKYQDADAGLPAFVRPAKRPA